MQRGWKPQGLATVFSPIMHLSKLKPVRTFPNRPVKTLTIEECDRVDFDEALIPEDSSEVPLEDTEYEVEPIIDVRSGRRTRYGRVLKEYKVCWKGYDETTWVDKADLNCDRHLHKYERRSQIGQHHKHRFITVARWIRKQSGEVMTYYVSFYVQGSEIAGVGDEKVARDENQQRGYDNV
ncbi:LOW QUALITY PROTEIN: Hypothetical protein PHPALM_11372 [Phytophthora palmivora]|uniref:Chromo domain-containing protein n=1 Tax=Phytophthora palmivora TaxID=4796 RepID=A0A2P4Y2G5_9STRA|nr:LOW QUALITY PROTEIN: Hypothetical protein PHPALM_11372 [Phytophthora palmivora]